MKKTGVIRSWNSVKGFGIIQVGGPASLERYFLHVATIKTGTALPLPGMEVHFDVSTQAVLEDQLPKAINADVIVPTDTTKAADLLASGLPSEQAEPPEGGLK